MADAKITQLAEKTTVAETDLVAIVDDPSGTPVTKKMTKANLFAPLVRENANTIAQRNSANNQAGYMYNTFIDTSNYARTRYGNNSGTSEIAAEAAGSESQGDVRMRRGSVSVTLHDGIMRPSNNGVTDLGDTTHKWNDIVTNRLRIANTIELVANANKARLLDGGGPSAGGLLRINDSNDNAGTIRHPGQTKSQFTSNKNDFNLESQIGYFQRWSSDASRDVTGISCTQQDGQVHLIINVGSFDIVLKHESASSTAANRFLNSTGADITLGANQAADIIYDGTTQRWRVFKRN